MRREDLLIEAEELAAMIDNPNLRLFDATVSFNQANGSDFDRYREKHIPGAAFLDHAAISSDDAELMYTLPDEPTLANKIGQLGITNDSIVVAYSAEAICWATRIWWVLHYAGHRNVRVLNGGLNAWQGEFETGAKLYEAAAFAPDFSPGMFADIEEVEKAAAGGGACVVNTLTPEIYAGEADIPYAGHIPGSINNSMFSLLDDSGRLLGNDELASAFEEHDSDKRFITYCGGGIAATTNACVAKLLGFKDVAVFDGSMSEWKSKDMPISKGSEPGTLGAN